MSRATVIVDRYRSAATQAASSNAYKGLRIHALPGLHDFVAQRAVEHFRAGAQLLDLAAGSGAMSQRLSDLGFRPTAVDYVSENFKLESVPFQQADLNEDFSTFLGQARDAIVASEIIEHLENPRHFARECFKLLVPGGRMIVSTPNVNNPASMASFVRTGRFLWFADKDYEGQGHITPLTQWQLHKCFTEAGFKFVWQGSMGREHSLAGGSPRLKLLSKLLTRLSTTPEALAGEIYVAVLEKPAAADPPA
jgi:SAM-dependent methyltransferase